VALPVVQPQLLWRDTGLANKSDFAGGCRCEGTDVDGIRPYSAMMRSAHSTRETKMAGLPNFAPQVARSFSETPRAREQAPQENTGICLATIFSRNSASGGQPMGITASDVALRIR